MSDQPKKIKIVVKPTGGAVIKKPVVKEEPLQKPKRKKGLIRKIVEIVSNDIHNLPNKIWGKKDTMKKVNMPESKESWKDWEGQL
jgi:hypothetical protein